MIHVSTSLFVVLVLLAPVRAAAQSPRPAPPQKAMLAVVGGFLIDGSGGPPRPDAVILIDGDRIVAVGREGELPVPPGAEVVNANGYSVLPGLIDAHVHLDLLGHADYPIWHGMVAKEYAEVMRLSAAQLLLHGITSALDCGGSLPVSVETRERIASGAIKGPRLLVSGGWIQDESDEQTARHYRRAIINNVHTPDEAGEAAKKLLDGGADHVKVYTGVNVEEVRAITEEAHRRGKFVGAHVYTDAQIQTALSGGVDILHHAGSGHQNPLFADDTLRMMAAAGKPVAQSIAHRVTLYPSHVGWPERLDDPTLRRELGKYADVIFGSLRDFPNVGYFRQIQLQMRVAPEAARQLYRGGVRLITGTDSGTPGNFHSESVWREMDALVRLAGLSPAEAITATTRDAAAALRLNTGLIVAGRLADLILIKGNPLENILYAQNVAQVIKGGVVQFPTPRPTTHY
jgi:imidazolonepropionase-like amidohydrolase